MLVQEILFWLSIIFYSESIRMVVMHMWIEKKPMKAQWFVILQTLTTAVTILAIVTFFIRARGLYCYREIEDIIVFDRSQRQELDFDSPAILAVFFSDN